MLSLKPKHLKRYKDVALLLMKYGRSDLVRQAGLTEALGEDTQVFDPDETVKAEELAVDFERLGPTFIKLGQLLSTRPDLLPPAYLTALTRLQDQVEPIPIEDVERIVSTELGVRLSRAFKEFQQRPLASASLAQVHLAILRDGRQVAVKVQRPGIRERIVDDLDAFEEIAEFLDEHSEVGRRYEFHRTLEVLRRTTLRELDFRNEASNLRVLHRNLQDFPRLAVPLPVKDYTTSRVLTMDYVSGPKITDLSGGELLEEERKTLADELFRAYLHQILVDGFFHADPHPGNLCFTTRRQIALLDLGMVVRVPPRLREHLLKLLLAVSEGRGEEAAQNTMKMGHPSRDFNKADFLDRIAHIVTDNVDASLERMKLGHTVLEIQAAAANNGIRLPEEITLISKALLNLEKTIAALDPDFDLHEAIRSRATEIMQRRTRSQMSRGSVYHSLLEVNEFAAMLPERLNKIMDLVAENELRVHVDAVDEAQLISGIQKIANRITMGLLLASLVIGAALMMDVETSLTLFGYPAIAMAFFLAAGTGAIVLIVQILTKDKRDKR